MTFGNPSRQSAIEDRDLIVPGPAQHPPQARRECAGALLVADDLVTGLQSLPAQPGDEHGRVGKRVAAVAAGFGRGEIALEMGEARAGEVRLPVFLRSPFRLREIVAAVEYAPPGMSGKLAARDERFQTLPRLRLSHSWKCSIASSIGDW